MSVYPSLLELKDSSTVFLDNLLFYLTSCFSLHSSCELTCIWKQLNYLCIVSSPDISSGDNTANPLASTSCKVRVCLSSLSPSPSPSTYSRTNRVKPLIQPVVSDDQVWHTRISNMASELFNRQDVGRGSGYKNQTFCSRDTYISGLSYRENWQLSLGSLLMQDGIKPVSPLQSYPRHSLLTLSDNLTDSLFGSTPLESSPNLQSLSKVPRTWAAFWSTLAPIHLANM